MTSTITDRIRSIDDYVSRNGLASYDPYDGLSSPWAKPLFAGSQMLARIWQQSIRLFPLNVRPLVGIKKIVHTKAISDFASAYSLLFASSGDEKFKVKAVKYLNLLAELNLPTRHGAGWGLRFPFATRFVSAGPLQANIFQTINAVHSFLDGYEGMRDLRYLTLAQKGMLFLEEDLGFVTQGDEMYWNYWENFKVEIYNISGLMIGLCARMWSLTHHKQYHEYAEKLYNYIRKRQNPDGSWPYAADPRGKFIDGFHTGYILEGIARGIIHGVLKGEAAFKKGVDFYLSNFFTEEGIPRYYNDSTYPIDGQNAAQALQTLYFIFNVNFAPKSEILKCFEQVDRLLWNAEGYYNYKRTKFNTYKTPMHRWVTGPMFLSLTYLHTIQSREL